MAVRHAWFEQVDFEDAPEEEELEELQRIRNRRYLEDVGGSIESTGGVPLSKVRFFASVCIFLQ